MWTHRKTIICGRGEPDDRQVLFNRRPVGRVYYAPNMWPEMRWSWACGSAHGFEPTMAEALERVRQAYLAAQNGARVLDRASPEITPEE